MIRINLLSARETEREVGRRAEGRLIVLGAMLAATMLLGIEVWSRMRMIPVRAEYADLQAQVKVLDTKTAELSELQKNKAELDEKLKTIGSLQQRKVGPANVLADLSDAAPEHVWLLEFTEDSGAATITGFAFDNQTIAVFMRNLGTSKYFTDVDLVETTQTAQKEIQLKKFVVKARLSYTGQPLSPASPDLKYPEPPKGGAPASKGNRV
ncbi:MAG: PilN domain-containing protein [Deltaproteobacteria bacterium]|nr:PilN domain-containing protein [Deltaproteobacteria bacterium]